MWVLWKCYIIISIVVIIMIIIYYYYYYYAEEWHVSVVVALSLSGPRYFCIEWLHVRLSCLVVSPLPPLPTAHAKIFIRHFRNEKKTGAS